jgi:hypothetical protein
MDRYVVTDLIKYVISEFIQYDLLIISSLSKYVNPNRIIIKKAVYICNYDYSKTRVKNIWIDCQIRFIKIFHPWNKSLICECNIKNYYLHGIVKSINTSTIHLYKMGKFICSRRKINKKYLLRYLDEFSVGIINEILKIGPNYKIDKNIKYIIK